jgi:hypothetical protein
MPLLSLLRAIRRWVFLWTIVRMPGVWNTRADQAVRILHTRPKRLLRGIFFFVSDPDSVDEQDSSDSDDCDMEDILLTPEAQLLKDHFARRK